MALLLPTSGPLFRQHVLRTTLEILRSDTPESLQFVIGFSGMAEN